MDALDELLGSIYDSVEQPAVLHDFTQRLRQATDSSAVEWWRNHGQTDPAGYRLMACAPEPPVSNSHQIPADLVHRARNEPDGLVMHEGSHCMATEGPGQPHQNLLVLHGSRRADTEMCSLLRRLRPHLVRRQALAERVWLDSGEGSRVTATAAPTQVLLDRVNAGVFFLDRSGRVVLKNCRADRFLDEPESGIKQTACWLQSETDETAGPQLQAAIQGTITDQARAEPSTVIRIRRPHRTTPILVALWSIEPTPMAAGHLDAHALAVASDPEDDTANLEPALRESFGMTPAEARVAQGVLQGYTTRAIADAMSVQESTVRQYLKSVLQKTGTSRQVELVRLLASGFALIRT